jgi:GntR family transcriptional repressor for pyruvate dehydrogenase complex
MNQDSLFRPVGSKVTLVDRVVDEMERLLLDGHLEPGTKLPPERELAVQLSVSRTVIREAVHILQTRGLLERQHGIGTMVRQPSSEQVARPLHFLLRTRSGSDISFKDLHQVRSILELETVAMAAENATGEEIENLKEILQAMEEAINEPEVLASFDADFHSALAEMAHNPLLVVLLNSVRDLLREYIALVTPYLDPGRDVMPSHYKILDCVTAKDPQGARQAMGDHLIQMHKNHEKFARLAGRDKAGEDKTT